MFQASANQSNGQLRNFSDAPRKIFRLGLPRQYPVYQGVSGSTRPYVTSISPVDNESGIGLAEPILIEMENRNGAPVTMTVKGSRVTPDIVDAGSTTTITYTPDPPFAGGETVPVTLEYGNATAAWSFVVEWGAQVLLFGGLGNPGDAWVSNRLATVHQHDVLVVDSTAIPVAEAVSEALASDLVYISSTVLGNNDNSQAVFTALSILGVPIILVEQASADELGIGLTSGTGPNGRTLQILNNTHPASNPNLRLPESSPHQVQTRVIGLRVAKVSATSLRKAVD